MAFMGRGNGPSLNNNSVDGVGNRFHGGHWYYRRYYYIPLDNTYVIMQMITTFIILIVGLIVFVVAYKSTIVDPITNIKRLFINTHLGVIGVLLAITLMINFFSKSEESLIKRLVIMVCVSIIVMLAFWGIKLNVDSTYTKEKFEQFYIEQNIDDNSSTKSKMDIGLTGINIKSEKEFYIDECVKLYHIFTTKVYTTLVAHFLLNILIIYQIVKISKMQGKKNKINKDDLILFDEEQNIKF